MLAVIIGLLPQYACARCDCQHEASTTAEAVAPAFPSQKPDMTDPTQIASPTQVASPTSPTSPKSDRGGGGVADAQPAIEVDPAAGRVDDGDDGYATDDYSRASTSLSSSVRDYKFENNRRYHGFREGAYHFPNDEPEQEREDMKHAMIVNLCSGRLHFAPLQHPQRILDVGTGTGIWAIDSTCRQRFAPFPHG